MDKRDLAKDTQVSEGARHRVTHSPVRKTECMTTRSHVKTGKTADDASESASPCKTDVMFDMLRDIQQNIVATTTVNNELGIQIRELSRRMDEIETSKKESLRDEGRCGAAKVSNTLPESARDSTSCDVSVGDNVPSQIITRRLAEKSVRRFKIRRTNRQTEPVKIHAAIRTHCRLRGCKQTGSTALFRKMLRGAAST